MDGETFITENEWTEPQSGEFIEFSNECFESIK